MREEIRWYFGFVWYEMELMKEKKNRGSFVLRMLFVLKTRSLKTLGNSPQGFCDTNHLRPPPG